MDELASLQESAREIAHERFRIIQPCLEQDRSLSAIARKASIPYRTIHRWLSRYRRFGLAALARKTREDRGRRRALSPQLLEIVEALALEVPPLPIGVRIIFYKTPVVNTPRQIDCDIVRLRSR